MGSAMKVSEWVTGFGETTVDVLCTGLSKKDELVLQSQSWIYVGETGRKEMPELKKRGSSHTKRWYMCLRFSYP
jgi:hypothetical protein